MKIRDASELRPRYENPFLSMATIVTWEDLGIPSKPTLADIGKRSPLVVIDRVKFGSSLFQTEYRDNRAFFAFYFYEDATREGQWFTHRNGTMAQALCEKLAVFNSGRPGTAYLGAFEVRQSRSNEDRAVIMFVDRDDVVAVSTPATR